MKSLISSVCLPLDNFHRKRLALIDDFDYSSVEAKTKKELLAGGIRSDDLYIQGGIHALKQYYAVALLDPKNMHAVSIAVDPFWHSHIIHTRDYHRFCEEVFNQYIHHTPLNEDDPRQMEEIDALYRYTYNLYREIFEDVDPFWWPNPNERPLICSHYRVVDPEVQEHALFPIHPVTEACLALA